MFYERMLAESNRLDSRIKELQSKLKQFPEGKLFCTKNRQYFKWYVTDGKTQTYIPKNKRPLAEKLAAKKYLSLLLEDSIREKRAIDFYLRHHNSERSLAEQMLLECPEYKNLIKPYFTPLSHELQEWANEPFESNPKHPEHLIHKTVSGKMVRSKSEVLIDMILYTNKIPFRYESPLQLNNFIVYPDFTIRHPQTGSIYHWEHFGLADDPEYCKKMNSKLALYTSHGIIPTINLITTYETKDVPLSLEQVEKIVDYYFL